MALNHFLSLAALTTCGLAYACSSSTGDTSEHSNAMSGSAGTAIDSQPAGGAPATASTGKSKGLAGKARDSDLAGSGGTASGDDDPKGEAGSAGWGMDALPPPPASAVPSTDQAHTECDLNGGCVSKCTDQTVTCSVESLGFACEMEGFVGASVPVACGQRVVVGTACCGSCGCVPVEVFFDGTSCWQGMPQCGVPAFNNHLFDPHAPGRADATSNTLPGNVPGSFFLGAAGASFGVTPAQAGNGGESAGGAGGAGSAGSAGTPAVSSAGSDSSGGGGTAGAGAGGGASAGVSGGVQNSAGGSPPSQP